jgi:hypothetical protein
MNGAEIDIRLSVGHRSKGRKQALPSGKSSKNCNCPGRSRTGQGRTSFLKKRSKKHLIMLASAFPDRASLVRRRFLVLFFKKEPLSATWPCLSASIPG